MKETPLQAPLYDALHTFAQERPLRMCMPGHKGVGLPVPELKGYAALDFTETSRTGNRQPAAVRAEQETNNLLRYGRRFPAGAVIHSRRELKQNIPGSAGLI